jgi:hypothetical protein
LTVLAVSCRKRRKPVAAAAGACFSISRNQSQTSLCQSLSYPWLALPGRRTGVWRKRRRKKKKKKRQEGRKGEERKELRRTNTFFLPPLSSGFFVTIFFGRLGS